MYKQAVYLCVILFLVASCERAELPVKLPPKPIEALRVLQVDLGEDYSLQKYINLFDTPSVKSSFETNNWDLSFECGKYGFRIFQNGGKGILTAEVGSEYLTRLGSNNTLKWQFDAAGGGDSIALLNWCDSKFTSNKKVYAIDLGIGNSPRYFQFKVLSVNENQYELEVANARGEEIKQVVVGKNNNKHLVYYNFSTNRVLDQEPEINNWHFSFLRYRFIYYEFTPPLQYIVTGIFINPNTISVAVDSTLIFENINLETVTNLTFSTRRDAMGFDWKIYDFNSGMYLTRKYVNYIIKLNQPIPTYYKLRFTDFYSSVGLKGSPKFEFVKINP
jgi:hypothetical protein